MKVVIITPERTLLEKEATQVLVPGQKAPFAMRPMHQAIISSLENGVVKITEPNGNELFVELSGIGLVEQHDDVVTILAGSAKVREEA